MTEKYILPADFKIISGGQTGADQAGLEWAIRHGVAHGGWCPKGRRSEDGPISSAYELVETPKATYLQRTEWNVRDADATVIFTLDPTLDGGSRRTADFAEKISKPWIHIRAGVHPRYLASFLTKHGVKTLNVAGKRESVQPGVHEFAMKVLDEALRAANTD